MERLQREFPWYRKWFDENYLLLYRHRDTDDAGNQVKLIQDTLLLPKDSLILDLGCGEGRYTSFFQNKGFRILGLDLSNTLIKSGRKKYPALNLVVGDMRYIPGKFDLVLSLFTSFGYFDTHDENQQVVCSVFQALRPGGWFWLDFLNPRYIENNLVAESLSRVKSGIQVEEKRKIESKRIIKDIFFKEKGMIRHYRESVRLYEREDLESMMIRSGFQVERCFGNYFGDEWSEDSERTILLGSKY